MTEPQLTVISHHTCPYVQRVVISLIEKKVPFERVNIDLANKPDWFYEISPLGKTPVLKVGDTAVFESAVILEYLEETQTSPFHPVDPLVRAENRSWIEFSSSVLTDISGFYGAKDEEGFRQKASALSNKFSRLEERLGDGPYFGGSTFSLVDVVFGPVFRYFDVFDQIDDFGILTDKPRTAAWRRALTSRPSIRAAVSSSYEEQLREFLRARNSYLSTCMG